MTSDTEMVRIVGVPYLHAGCLNGPVLHFMMAHAWLLDMEAVK